MKSRIYFTGLDGIRFWASILVVLGHMEQLKSWFGVTNGSLEETFFLARFVVAGNDAVMAFFVLSGFLITYLLLVEIQRTETVSVKNFYVRRSLRIMPLYYLVMMIGFFLVPMIGNITGIEIAYQPISENFAHKFGLYFFFLPHIAQIFGYFPTGITQLWSIGVEEYFYLIYPQLVKLTRKNILIALIGILYLRLVILWLSYQNFASPEWAIFQSDNFVFWLDVIARFPFEPMAIGGLIGFIYFHQKERLLKFLYHPIIWLLMLAFYLANFFAIAIYMKPFFIAGGTPLMIIAPYVKATVYGLFILNVSTNPRFPIKLENGIYRFLGKLSYGIYMYHLVIVYGVLIAFEVIGYRSNTIVYNLTYYGIVIGSTILIAYLSYRFFETPFLRLKRRFTIVESGLAIDGEKAQVPS